MEQQRRHGRTMLTQLTLLASFLQRLFSVLKVLPVVDIVSEAAGVLGFNQYYRHEDGALELLVQIL